MQRYVICMQRLCPANQRQHHDVLYHWTSLQEGPKSIPQFLHEPQELSKLSINACSLLSKAGLVCGGWLREGPTGELIDDQGSSLPIRVLVSYVTDPPLDLISSLIKRASAPIKLQSALYKSIRCKVTLTLHRASKSKSTSKHLTNGQKSISKVMRCISFSPFTR